MTYADLERLYLDGKISAKQYQRLLNEIQSHPQPPAASTTQPKAQPAPSAAAQPAAVPPNTNKEDKINEVENKMDALIRAKEARDKAATNAAPRPTVAGPKTKRDRLNDLLRLYIEGKITETDLNERRAKILAEPD